MILHTYILELKEKSRKRKMCPQIRDYLNVLIKDTFIFSSDHGLYALLLGFFTHPRKQICCWFKIRWKRK